MRGVTAVMTGMRPGRMSDVSPWSQCALTDHLLITRDWGLLSPAPARGAHWTRSGLLAAVLRPRVPVLVPSTPAPVTTQQTGLFQLQRREAEERARVSHPSVTPTSRRQTETALTSGDIWNHLSSWDFSGMTDGGRILSNISTMPPPIYQSFKPEQRSIVSKKLSAL